ncbi:LolA family protein [Candidatus Nitrospira allomarina]|uniref:Outer membrane lipoprotein carrier protein LolA n=1 Tax=Candidatus Nitrospira allomarina TaxID=3020900 RepID=A0AA96GAX8_9BACT|nr:outer membrane lipoprotein carrier protein LolA [Candidatus Nitrospira allomarina]WNM58689.1 outer membrane lipoprotein carrier protein LolA [Candidatus Nitrospira allomarina]
MMSLPFLRWAIYLGIICFMMPVSDTSAASVSVMEDIVAKVDARYAQTKDLQADFVQETILEGFTTGFTSSGRLYLKKPGLLRWDYLHPSEEQIYVNGDQVMMYVPEHQQVVKGALTQMAASKGPLALLQGAGNLSQQFTILESADGSKDNEKFPSLTLVPKPVDQTPPTIKKIVLKLFPDTYFIQGITLFEVSGNISHVMFDHIQANTGLSSSQLTFDVPPDVVVVELP